MFRRQAEWILKHRYKQLPHSSGFKETELREELLDAIFALLDAEEAEPNTAAEVNTAKAAPDSEKPKASESAEPPKDKEDE